MGLSKDAYPFMSTRVNITPGSKEIKRRGIPGLTHPDLFKVTQLPHGEAVRIWSEHSQEAFEITAVVIDRIVMRALNDRPLCPPFGLAMLQRSNFIPNTHIKNLNELRSATKQSLGISQYLETTELDKPENTSPMARVYHRYNQLFEFTRNNIGRAAEAILDIEAGINSAANSMIWTLENIIEVHQRDFSGEELSLDEFTKIAKNSWPLVAERASMHRHDFSQTTDDPDDMILVSSNNGYHLDYKPEARQRQQQQSAEAEVEDRDLHPTYGCPAMVNFGEGSAVKNLWDWSIENANLIYNINYMGQPITRLLAS